MSDLPTQEESPPSSSASPPGTAEAEQEEFDPTTPSVHLAGGPDVADQIVANPSLVHRSAAHHAAIGVPPDQRTPEEAKMADQLGAAIEAIPEEERTPHQKHTHSLWHAAAPAPEPQPAVSPDSAVDTAPAAQEGKHAWEEPRQEA